MGTRLMSEGLESRVDVAPIIAGLIRDNAIVATHASPTAGHLHGGLVLEVGFPYRIEPHTVNLVVPGSRKERPNHDRPVPSTSGISADAASKSLLRSGSAA